MYCGKCGAKNEPGAAFCGACGAPLEASTTAGAPVIEGEPVSAQAADGAGAGFVPRTNPADSAGTRHGRNGELE